MKTFQEVENYLAEKRKKDEAYQRKQKQNDSFVYDTQKGVPRLGQRRTRFPPVEVLLLS
jgi:transcriptional adapter 2-alpha